MLYIICTVNSIHININKIQKKKKNPNMTIQIKATSNEKHFLVGLVIMLSNTIITFKSVDKNLHCNNSNE